MMTSRIVGIDLGATKIAAGLVSREGEITARLKTFTEVKEGPTAVIARIVACIRQIMAEAPGGPESVPAIGICAPGPLDHRHGVVLSPPNLTGWRDVPLKVLVEEQTGLPTFIEHDAKAAALAEYHFGAGQGADFMIYVTVSTGIGAGILVNGELLRGCANVAGEIGHITIDINGPPCSCGRRGCVEALAGGPAIARAARQAIEAGSPSRITEWMGDRLEDIDAEVVTRAAQEGDDLARRVLHDAGTYLGVGMATLANLINPQHIVIGGGVSKAGALLLEPTRQAMRQWAYPIAADTVEIVPATLGDDVGILGAGLVAWLNLEQTANNGKHDSYSPGASSCSPSP